MDNLTVIQQNHSSTIDITTVMQVIDSTDKAKSTKEQYKAELAKAISDGVNFADIGSIKKYADTLPLGRKIKLKSALKLLAKVTIQVANANVTTDNLEDVQVMERNLNGMLDMLKFKVPTGEKLHTWLNPSQVVELLGTCDTNDLRGKRDKILLGLLVCAGLRRVELTTLKFSDIKEVDGRVCINLKEGKGNKNRIIPIQTGLAEAIKEWQDICGDDGLIVRGVSKWGVLSKSITNGAVYQIVKKAGATIGEDGLSPHDLRRTYARIGYNAGVPIAEIALLLGHSDTKVTMRYLNIKTNFKITVSDFVPFC